MSEKDQYAEARRSMVEQQLRRRGITAERVLQAMERVPRHRFLPRPDDPGAYGDYPLPIGDGQTISQPYMVAIMTEALRVEGDEKVLEIGAGSGYQAAILAELAREVYSIERFITLAERARNKLAELGYDNVTVVVGDGSKGYPEHAPYDRIIVTAASPKLANPWTEQLAEGGVLLAPVGDRWGQTLLRVTRHQGKLEQENLGGCVFVPLIGEHGWAEE
ncbi:MAG: protein-L-isoaspartate(D-aspartate) O-methyltransferase [Armatimonadetes bacterium]|nr:protein-L-isoaspartate(D-aspartate) O-methyltransferase [Armatimonadota bacterium]